MNDVASLGTIMTILAHPDDETFMCGGLLALAAQNGQEVVCVTATRGEAGVYDPLQWPAASIGAVRAVELTDSLRILGVRHHEWLHFRDGNCDKVGYDEAVSRILPLLQKYNPDTIVTFAPDGMTGHLDHRSVSRWAELAAAEMPKRPKILYGVNSQTNYDTYLKPLDEKLNIFFNIDQPDLYNRAECDLVLDLVDDVSDKKCRALKAMPSQTAIMLKHFDFDYLCQAFGEECFVFAGRQHTR